MKRWGKRKKGGNSGGPAESGSPARRANPVRRRLLTVGAVVVAGVMVYLLSVRPKEGGEGTLEGKVTLDGQPFGGATVFLRGEERTPLGVGQGKVQGPVIGHFLPRPVPTDADGRYRVERLRPGLVYTVRVSRTDHGEQPLRQEDGTLPSVEVGSGLRHFDVNLSSAASGKEKARR